MADNLQSNPLAHLGHRLTKEVEEGSTSSSGEFKKASEGYAPSDALPIGSGSRFSIGNWRAKISQRAIDQKLSFDLRNSSCRSEPPPARDAGFSLGRDAPAGDVVVNGSALNEMPSGGKTDDLIDWLVGAFEARDAGRTERTVVALKSLAQAGEMKRAEDMLALAREGILTLTREGWHMLQERDPTVMSNLSPPGQAPTPTAEQHAARSSRCATYLLLGPRVSRRAAGTDGSDDCGNGVASGSSEVETPSTGLSPAISTSRGSSIQAASRESSVTWSDASERLQHVISIDDDDLSSSDARFSLGHRDDWELQYMLNGVFEELQLQLESGTAQDLAALLQGARSRVLEWTVRRWQSCRSQPL